MDYNVGDVVYWMNDLSDDGEVIKADEDYMTISWNKSGGTQKYDNIYHSGIKVKQMPEKRIEFLMKLRSLLDEYNVSIDAGYEGDTHGIYGKHITINHRPDKNSFKEVKWLTIHHQIRLTAQDIDQEI